MQNVLLIEDNPGDARLIHEMIAEEPDTRFALHRVERLAQGLQHLSANDTALVLLDLSLPDSLGLETFSRVYAHAPEVPIIVLTGNDDRELALTAVQRGAQDYLAKGRLDRELLLRSMHYSVERKRYQKALEHQANYDALTGLPNRNLLADRLRQALQDDRRPHPVAVVFIDLDHFKRVNDSLGHTCGDRLLKAMGKRLRSALREGDTAARIGGDEFVLVLKNHATEADVFRTMERISAQLARPIEIDGRELVVTCSAGISLFPQDGTDVDTLLKNADAAMYRAKEQGRNAFLFYRCEMNERISDRLALESALRRALERGELGVHYQPRFDLRSGALVGAEALARWELPDGSAVSPTRFIPLAEDTGLILPLGEFVLREACRQTRSWLDEGLDPGVVSVNLSARQLRQEALVPMIAGVLRQTGLEATRLEMEITESSLMHNLDVAAVTLAELKALGASLAVDDFGTGYSSLSYLHRLPIDKLKIDRSFVRHIGIAGDVRDGLLARAIISLGHELGLRVVAEGVETEPQAHFLRRHHCDEVQGFLYSKPLSAPAFRKLIGVKLIGVRPHFSASRPDTPRTAERRAVGTCT